ncbi:UDP-glycosyltransferase 89B2 [Tanacetum coccineum]
MEVVAMGLEKSHVRFIWVVKGPTIGHVAGKYSKIPHGFEDRVAGRGLVLRGLVPQVAILGHDSVGVFLTHYGWNSIMEGVKAEVIMLTWPMTADQHMNATMLKTLQLGIKFLCGKDALGENGSSCKELDRLVDSLSR